MITQVDGAIEPLRSMGNGIQILRHRANSVKETLDEDYVSALLVSRSLTQSASTIP